MIYRPYGNTGSMVSAIGFGGMRFAQIEDKDACIQLIHRAYGAGINYFDTAPGYFGGKSEERFGEAFQDMLKTKNEHPFFVSTKSNKADPEDIRRDLEASLRRLQLDYVDFFHMWWVVRPEWYYDRKAKGALKEMEKMRDEGLIRHIVLSSHMSGSECREVLVDYPFEGVLLGYSAMNFPFRDDALNAAAETDRGVVVMNPLGGGIIPAHTDRFRFLKTHADESVVQAAIRFLLNDTRITTVLVGMAEPEHVDEAVGAATNFQPISPKKYKQLRDAVCRNFNEMCTGCGYCLPCPAGLSIPKLMQSYNERLFSKEDAQVINRMKWGHDIYETHRIDACTQCGLCEQRCTQKLPIRRRLRSIREIITKHEAIEAAKMKAT